MHTYRHSCSSFVFLICSYYFLSLVLRAIFLFLDFTDCCVIGVDTDGVFDYIFFVE